MKVPKKGLCLLLVAIFLIGLIPGAGAENVAENISFPDVDGSTYMGQAIEALVRYEIITGYGDGQYKPDLTITRAEFAKVIVCFLNAGDMNLNMPSGFPDVDNVGGAEHWAKSYIKVAKDLNIIVGFEDGTFRPDDPVTYEQAVKMIMCARNYTGLAYPDGYMALATQKQLFKNSNHIGIGSEPVKRGTVAILVYNALSVADANATTIIPNIPSTGGGGSGLGGGSGSGGAGGGTSASYRYKDGIVTGTGVTMLYTPLTYLDEDELYLTSDDGDEQLPVGSGIDPSNYLGRFVRVAIKENSEGEEFITSIDVRGTQTKIKRIKHTDYIGYADGEIKFYDGQSVDSAKLEALDTVDVIYNDKAVGTFDPRYLENFIIGDLTLISNDGDSQIDVIIMTSYQTGVVKSRNVSGNVQTVVCKFGAPNINLTERARNVTIRDASGSTMQFTDIKMNDVIDYRQSEDGERMEAIVTRSNTAKTSKITQVELSAEKPYIKFENDNTRYYLNYNYINYLSDDTVDAGTKYVPTVGNNVTAYFNKEGRIAGIEVKEEVYSEKYGYIVATGYDHDREYAQEDTDRIAVKLYTMDEGTANDFKIIYIAQTVIVDGTTYTRKPDEVREILREAATVVNANKSTTLNKTTAYSQLVRYELSNNQISVIDTVLGTPDTRYNKLVRSQYVYEDTGEGAVGDGRYTYSSSLPGFERNRDGQKESFKVYTSSNGARTTKLIFIPSNRNNRSLYRTKTFNTSTCTSGMRYYIEAYNINANGYAEILLQFITDGSDELTANSTVGVIQKPVEYSAGGEAMIYYYSTDGNPLSVAVDASFENDPILNELEEGDVIQFSKNAGGKVINIRYVMDTSNRPISPIAYYEQVFNLINPRIHAYNVYPDEPVSPPDSVVAKYRMQYGTAVEYTYGAAASSITVNSVLGADTELTPSEEQDFTFDIIGSTRMFVYDGNAPEESRITTFRSKAAIDEWLEEYLVTAEGDYSTFEGLDHIMIYSARKSAGQETEAKVIVVYKNVDTVGNNPLPTPEPTADPTPEPTTEPTPEPTEQEQQ